MRNEIHEIDIYQLAQRGLIYVTTGRSKRILELENHIKSEPLDLFREDLELWWMAAVPMKSSSSPPAKKQTLHHIETIYSLVENMSVSAKQGENPKLVERYAQLYFTGDQLTKTDSV